MAAVESEEDQRLREEFLAFGENVGKFTEKNRPILIKKLNHLRARKRMSEKLSLSMLEEKAPKTGAKGRGKKVGSTNAEVVAANIKRLSIDLVRNESLSSVPDSSGANGSKSDVDLPGTDASVVDIAPPPAKKGRAARGKKIEADLVSEVQEIATAPGDGDQQVATRRGGRKSVVPRVDVTAAVKSSDETTTVSRVRPNAPKAESVVPRVEVTTAVKSSDETTTVSRGRANAHKAESQKPGGRGRKSAVPSKAEAAELRVDVTELKLTEPNDFDKPPIEVIKVSDDEDSQSSDVAAVSVEDDGISERSSTIQGNGFLFGEKDRGKTTSRIPKLSRGPENQLQSEPLNHITALAATSTVSSSSSLSPKLTVQVIDTTVGRPAGNIPIYLHHENSNGSWNQLGYNVTDAEGKYADFTFGTQMKLGDTYRVHVKTGAYLHGMITRSCYPYVDVVFTVDDVRRPVHIQLLLGPFGYSVNRIA